MSEEIRKKIDFSVKSFKPESDQTAFKIGAEFGYQLAQEELKKNQDELWEELNKLIFTDGFLHVDYVKKRYRITRI